MLIKDFISKFPQGDLSSEQEANLGRIAKLSERFHRAAGIDFPEFSPSVDLVVETGHQPNFLPHAGTFKKAYLADHLKKERSNVVALFGFADYNLSTAPVLSQNKIPAVNREGAITVGYKIKPEERRRMFHTLKKPSPDAFEAEITKIKAAYPGALEEVTDIMRSSYERAKNAADLNAFIFAGICEKVLGLNIFFYRYTDVQKDGLFLPVWKDALERLTEYNAAYNNAITENPATEMHPVSSDALPFWKHCSCGAKTLMHKAEERAIGSCPMCGADLSFDLKDLQRFFPDLSPTAVSRNVFFAEGLGTGLFISGSGGSLMYGKISNMVAKKLNYNLPATLAWKSRDQYLGNLQKKAADDVLRYLAIDPAYTPEGLLHAIKERADELHRSITEAGSDKKTALKYSGQLTTLKINIEVARKVYSLTPSFIDELASAGKDPVKSLWDASLKEASVDIGADASVIKQELAASIEAVRVCKAFESLPASF